MYGQWYLFVDDSTVTNSTCVEWRCYLAHHLLDCNAILFCVELWFFVLVRCVIPDVMTLVRVQGLLR